MWQEYRYDALGRRVMAAASFEAPCENGCRSYTDFVVWSGDQMIGELRGEFGGDTYGAGSWQRRIAYTHDPGIDAPLSFVRHGLNAAPVTIVPHANWRGTYGAGTYKNGSTAGILDLTTVHWPADDLGAYLAPTEPYAEDQPWVGALIGNIRDANGWLCSIGATGTMIQRRGASPRRIRSGSRGAQPLRVRRRDAVSYTLPEPLAQGCGSLQCALER